METSLRKTRIVCTIGPASSSPEVIRHLLEAGMNIARLNFSHGDHAGHEIVYKNLRQASEEMDRPLAILMDLCGPKIRLGKVAEGTRVETGDLIEIVDQPVMGSATQLSVTYPGLNKELRVGDRLLVDDGKLEFTVEECRPESLIVRVKHGGLVWSKKGVNLPGAVLSVPALTAKDEADLRFGLQMGVDMVALSFVRRESDLDRPRAIMDELGIRRPLIAKIEKPQALDELPEIVRSADAIMVARGDLGIEIPLEEVPIVQKEAIALAIKHARPVITATQMLESMISCPTPTRAEVTDVANAIFDGTDAIMLSGETASGSFPVLAVQVMHRIAMRTERNLNYAKVLTDLAPKGQNAEAVALAACEIAEEVQARAIVACTNDGSTVHRLARDRPRAPILAITPSPELARELLLCWGVVPRIIKPCSNVDELLAVAEEAALSTGWLQPGDLVVLVAGMPLGHPTNTIQLRRLAES